MTGRMSTECSEGRCGDCDGCAAQCVWCDCDCHIVDLDVV